MAALVFPTAAEAASQTPVNTFSPTSTPLANTSNTNTYVYDSTLAVWTASGAGGGGSSVTAATLAEAATGTSNTVFSSPQTSVPKDASGMTGAALIPTGTTAQQPGTPANGWLRYNTTYATNNVEVYSAATTSWKPLQYAQPASVYPDLTISSGSTVNWNTLAGVYNNVTINGTVNLTGLNRVTAYGNVVIGGTAIFNGNATGAPGGVGAISGAAIFVAGTEGRGYMGGNNTGLNPTSAFCPTYTIDLSPLGSGGGGAAGYNGVGGSGGFSGASLIFDAGGSITCAASVNLKGGAGGNGAAGAFGGGGGGGSGGLLCLISETSINISGTLDISGGNGGAGANGSSSGGGGGGGGWLVLLAPSVSNTCTVTRTGGTNGTPNGVATYNLVGASGGSFGGLGGQSGFTVSGYTADNIIPTAGVINTNGSYT